MQEKQTQKQCQNSSYFAEVFRVRRSAQQAPEKDSEIREALSSLSLPAWLKPGSLSIYDNFRELLFACNIPHTGNGPRVHDFRHTFAVHTLEKQLSDGYDPMVIVPRLAAYLGHKSYRETCWYIHLTVASFPELSQKLDRAFVGIIPVGGETDEEN